MWTTPKTNWQPAAYVGVTDVNRIKNNLEHLYNLAKDYVGTFEFPNMGSNFSIATDIKASDFNRFENALDKINNATYEEEIGQKKTYSGNGFTIDYNELNRIEIASLTLYQRFRTQDSNGGLEAAPVITVNPSGWTSAASYPISGTITTETTLDFAKIYYTYNDEEVEKELAVNNDGTFIQMVPLQNTVNTMRIKAVDSEGNVSAISFIKQRDSSYPTLTISSPASSNSSAPTVATSSSYRVSGTVSDTESGITSVKVNGYTATRSGNDWYYTLTGLQAGQTKTITVTATNGAGLQTTLTRYVMFDATPPNIVINSSTASRPVSGYTLTGQISDAHSGISSVTVNGNGLSGWDGLSFSYNASLAVGANTFEIVAVDGAGNRQTATASVTRINDVNNTNANWSNHQRSGATPNKAYDDIVYVNGTWYTYAQKRWSDAAYDHDKGGYSYTDATANVQTSIPLPKGLSSLAFNGWNCRSLNIRDATTNSYIATGQNSVSASMTQEQSMHDLYLDIDAHAYQYQYQSATADCGVSSWTFNYYT